MNSIEALKNVLKRQPTKLEIAGHIADLISAQQRIQTIARQNGDTDLIQITTLQIVTLRKDAQEAGITPDTHPSIFKIT